MHLDVRALETSFDAVAPRRDELVDEFYRRLFEVASAVLPLFADTDMQRQKTMLLGTLILLRKSLRDLSGILPKLGSLVQAMGPTGRCRSTTRSSEMR
jgi:hemoglobin-like flavoprotein